MADYDVTLSESLMPDLLERPNALAQLVESALQQGLQGDRAGESAYSSCMDRLRQRRAHR